MGKPSRDKGKRGELEVRDVFRANGVDANRTAQLQTGMRGVGDVSIHPDWYVEVKRCEKLAVSQWLAQIERDRPGNAKPILAFRRSREDWWAVVPLTVLADLIGRLER